MPDEIFIGITVESKRIRVGGYNAQTSSSPLYLIEVPTNTSFESDLYCLRRVVSTFADWHTRVAGIGLAIAGIFDTMQNEIIADASLSAWHGQPIRPSLEGAFPGVTIAIGTQSLGQALANAIHGHIEAIHASKPLGLCPTLAGLCLLTRSQPVSA